MSINIDSILQRSLSKATKKINTSMERISSGLKINNAGDDPAGLSIATKLNTQIRGLNQVQGNIQTGINIISIADSSLDSMNTALKKIKTLATKAADGVWSDSERAEFQAEADQLIESIKQTKNSTKFSSIELLKDSGSDDTEITLQIGTTGDESSRISFDTSFSFDDLSIDLSTADAARASIDKAEALMNEVGDKRAYLGTYSNILESQAENNSKKIENLTASKSTIMSADISKESAELTKQQILFDITNSLIAQNNNNNYAITMTLLEGTKLR